MLKKGTAHKRQTKKGFLGKEKREKQPQLMRLKRKSRNGAGERVGCRAGRRGKTKVTEETPEKGKKEPPVTRRWLHPQIRIPLWGEISGRGG